jgi:hypothetical protein
VKWEAIVNQDRRVRHAGWKAWSVAAALAGVLATQQARAEDLWRYVPEDTRVVFQVNSPQVDRQPMARDALGTEPILARLVSRRLPATERKRQIVAYVQEGKSAQPVVFTCGSPQLEAAFKKLQGERLESIGGKELHAAGPSGWAAALLDASCVVEGPRQTLRAVLEGTAAGGKSLAGAAADAPSRRLLGVSPTAPTAVTLFYFSPEGGRSIYQVLQDLDSVLGVEMGASLAAYQSALKMLGETRGLRLDLAQEGDELGTILRLAMPNSMAANLTSVSLLAGKDMARAASDAAVQAGKMTEQDATVLAGALSTLQAEAEGDLVLVRVRVADVASRGSR